MSDSSSVSASSLARSWVFGQMCRFLERNGQKSWAYEGSDNPVPITGAADLIQARDDGYEGHLSSLEGFDLCQGLVNVPAVDQAIADKNRG
jgi:hypothetical protein